MIKGATFLNSSALAKLSKSTRHQRGTLGSICQEELKSAEPTVTLQTLFGTLSVGLRTPPTTRR